MNFVCKRAKKEKMNSYPLIYFPDLSKHIYYAFYLVIQTKIRRQGENEKQ